MCLVMSTPQVVVSGGFQ